VDDQQARLCECLTRLRPHVNSGDLGLTGGVAIDLHLAQRGLVLQRGVVNDVDFVAARRETVSPSVTSHFLVSHFHLPQPGYPKFLLQLVDPVSRLRVDVFPDLAGSLRRARTATVAGVECLVLDAESILEHKIATLANASPARLVERKHYDDAVRLGSMLGRPVPVTAAAHLCDGDYSGGDLDARCPRCEVSSDSAFALAPKRKIFDILGYV